MSNRRGDAGVGERSGMGDAGLKKQRGGTEVLWGMEEKFKMFLVVLRIDFDVAL